MTWIRGYVSLERLLDWVRTHPIKTSGRLIPICVWGRAGAAKTQKVHNYCRANNLGIRIYHPAYDKSAADLVGSRSVDPKTGHVVISIPDWLPVEGECEKKGVLFIDEINRGGKDVLSGLFQPLGEGEIRHIGWKLPPGWIIVCAANPKESDYSQVIDLDQAMVRRMVNYVPGWNSHDWASWGLGDGQIDPMLMDFVFETPHLVDAGPGNIMPENVQPVANARTLEYFNALYEPNMPLDIFDVCATGLLGKAAAERLLFLRGERDRGIQPLRGADFMSGVAASTGEGIMTMMQYWASRDNLRIIRGSTGHAIALLYGKQPPGPGQSSEVAHNIWMWLCQIPDKLIPDTLANMEISIPDWLDFFYQYHQGELQKRVPENRYEITMAKEHLLQMEQKHEETAQAWDDFEIRAAELRQRAADNDAISGGSSDPFSVLDGGAMFRDEDDQQQPFQ